MGFLFGSINSRQDVFGSTLNNTADLVVEKNRFLRQFFWKLGGISEHEVGNSTLAIGLTYQPSISLVSTEEALLKDAGENTLYEEPEKKGKFEFPAVASAGISISNKKNVLLLSFLSQTWKKQ